MAEPWKPCPVCGLDRGPEVQAGSTYRERVASCTCCGWGFEFRVNYTDDIEDIAETCRAEWNDRRTWEERTND